MCECQSNPLARVTLALGLPTLPACKQDLTLYVKQHISSHILFWLNNPKGTAEVPAVDLLRLLKTLLTGTD